MSGSMKVRIKTLICTLPFVGISIYIKKKRKKKIVNRTGSGMGSRKSLEKRVLTFSLSQLYDVIPYIVVFCKLPMYEFVYNFIYFLFAPCLILVRDVRMTAL